mmetsp:Transcript_2658/g.4548  ORF Transcript_2658/g.4548 Transcript_2658/m.4548 type:complete len:247 (-) Transcript_2658:103-843(-)
MCLDNCGHGDIACHGHGDDSYGNHHSSRSLYLEDVSHGCACSCTCEGCSAHRNTGHADNLSVAHSHGDGHFQCTTSTGRAHMNDRTSRDHPATIATEDVVASDPCPECNIDKCKWAERCNRKKKCRFCHCGVERVLRGPTKAKRGSRGQKPPSASSVGNYQAERGGMLAPPMRSNMDSKSLLAEDAISNRDAINALGGYSPGLLLRTWAATPVENPVLATASLTAVPDSRSPVVLQVTHHRDMQSM